jgi:ribosomal protein S18 acetylase RimI-like enzyme
MGTDEVSAKRMTFGAPMIVRPARVDDYQRFAALFLEMKVDDAVATPERFQSELLPTTLIAEHQNHASGYAYFQVMDKTLYVRNVVTAPEARARGVGTALMQAMAARAREMGCTEWCLNVKPDNTPALRLYEKMGLHFKYTSKALRINWADVMARRAPPHEPQFRTRRIEVDEEARVERETGLVSGQLATSRETPDRIQWLIEAGHRVLGAAIFHPHFPGAYPFRISDASLALEFLKSLCVFANPEPHFVNLVIEGQPQVADVFLRAGATLRLDIVHLTGAL